MQAGKPPLRPPSKTSQSESTEPETQFSSPEPSKGPTSQSCVETTQMMVGPDEVEVDMGADDAKTGPVSRLPDDGPGPEEKQMASVYSTRALVATGRTQVMPSQVINFGVDPGIERSIYKDKDDSLPAFGAVTKLETAIIPNPSHPDGQEKVQEIPEEMLYVGVMMGRAMNVYLFNFIFFSVLVMGSVYAGAFVNKGLQGWRTRTEVEEHPTACLNHDDWVEPERDCHLREGDGFQKGYRIIRSKPQNKTMMYEETNLFDLRLTCYKEQHIPCYSLPRSFPRAKTSCWNYQARHEPRAPVAFYDRCLHPPHIIYEDAPVFELPSNSSHDRPSPTCPPQPISHCMIL